jgi:hypothetical protein
MHRSCGLAWMDAAWDLKVTMLGRRPTWPLTTTSLTARVPATHVREVDCRRSARSAPGRFGTER